MPEAHRDAQIDVWFFASERNTNLSFSKKILSQKLNTHLASHFTCSQIIPFCWCMSNAPANHLRWCQSTVARWGAGAATKKKNTLRWDIVEYLERAESFGFAHGLKATPSSHQERSRSTSKEISNKDPKYHLYTMIHCKKASKKCSSLKKKPGRSLDLLLLTPCTLLMKPPTCRSWCVIFCWAARIGPRSDANMPGSNSSIFPWLGLVISNFY